MSAEGREIAKYFYGKTGLRGTQKVWFQQVSAADALLTAGYTKEEILKTIDYLKDNPPRNGFHSLAFVQYIIEEALIKVKAREQLQVVEAATEADIQKESQAHGRELPPQVEATDDNRRIYEEQSKRYKFKI